MSEPVVLDSSAILAVINGEPGQETVIPALLDAVVCAVNLAEVVGVLADRGMPADRAYRSATTLGFAVVPLDERRARAAGAMRPLTRSLGLSLGDRCCLALGQQRAATVLTTDSAWSQLPEELGIRTRNIRRAD